MTLEDFFTLSEMKNGLATLARVEELIDIMQKQDFVMCNAGDAPRQWSTVAGTIAATENKDCLNHFIKLNGLCILNHWLQEALSCSSDNNMEELISALLGSFERLPLDTEKPTASGIWSTIAQLLCHKSKHINERARILSEKWNQAATSDLLYQTKDGAQNDQPKPLADAQTTGSISPCKADAKEGCCGAESAGTESNYSNVTGCSNSMDTDNNVEIPTSSQITATSSSLTDANAIPGDMNSLGSSLITNSCKKNCSITEKSSVCPLVGMASSTCSLSVSRRERDNQGDASVLKDADGEKMEVEANITEVCTGKHHGSSNVPSTGFSTSLTVTEPTLPSNLESKEIKASISEPVEPHTMNMDTDFGLLKCLSTKRELSPGMDVVKSPQDLSSTECKLKKMDDPETSVHREEAVESVTDIELVDSEMNLKLSKRVDIMSPSKVQKFGEVNVAGEMDHRSEETLECGDIDALEVARQVAIEVEREVVENREPFSKSSPETSSGKIAGVIGPDFEEDTQDEQVTTELNRNIPPNRKDLSCGNSSPDDSLRLPKEIDIDPGLSEHGRELPESGTVDQQSDCKIDRRKGDFDLNEDISTEEFDCLVNPVPNDTVNLSVPIAVSASKGAPVLPVAPLQFQGELGWKGSAATSAFRPASPRRTPDSEKAYSSQKQKTNILQFDLNVAESEVDAVVDPKSAKPMPVSSGFPFGDSYVEVGSKRAERLKLDLNRLGDEDVLPNPSTRWMLPLQNGDQSLSPASSSTSRQPPMRDFDLNDHPTFLGVGGSHNLSMMSSKAYGTYGSSKHEPDIMIMGSRMAERKDYVNGVQPFFLRNGSGMESATPLLPYPYMSPSAYGYNRLPKGSPMPFTPALYSQGSFPYMVDSRGTAVMPQVMDSAGINGAHLVTPPHLMGVTGAPSLNGISSSQSGLDLNYGMLSGPSGQSGSREGGSRQAFMQGHYGLMEAQATVSAQPVVSGMTVKRKEPDCGWEPVKRKEPDCGWEPYAFVTNR